MNPLFVTRRLKDVLTRYLLTTFDVNRDGKNTALYEQIRRSFEADKALMTGPFLELAQPYRQGLSTQALIEQGVLSERLASLKNPPIPLDSPLYQHQHYAAERIADGRSVIVSSGTGSGKTESFLLPILSDLLERPAKGVRALLIYPLNALVNDQLRRLSDKLVGTNITYGRYTSELEDTTAEGLEKIKKDFPNGTYPPNLLISREQIRTGEMIPNILITNYAMLEYLLLRPEDSGIFDYPSDWKYIVLDEAHSYTGSKGIEVAYLLRRLKQRLGKSPREMVCIGTSATLTEDKDEAVEFAEKLFGEPFLTDDIVFGESEQLEPTIQLLHTPPNGLDGYLMDGWDALLDGLRVGTVSAEAAISKLRIWQLVAPSDTAASADVGHALHTALMGNMHVQNLLNGMVQQPDKPLDIQEAVSLAFGPEITQSSLMEDSTNALHRLVELCSYARQTPDSPSILPARYHVFARSPLGVWVCLNPVCSGRPQNHSEPWLQIFSTPRLTCDSCSATVYPITVCRECGQVYVKTVKSGEEYHTQAPNLDPSEPRYFVWSKVDVNDALASEDDEDVQPAQTDAAKTRLGEPVTLCLCCKRTSRCGCGEKRQPTKLYPVVELQTKAIAARDATKDNVVTTLATCVRCQKTSRIDKDEIATEVNIKGSTPLAVMMTELYRHLPESSEQDVRNKPGKGRKLLSFYDSRQGAARYAAFLQDVFNQDVFRNLVPTVLREAGEALSFPTLTSRVIEQGWQERIFQNTLEHDLIDAVQSGSIGSFKSLSKGKREKIEKAIKARLIAKLTTDLSSRQSLEALGLLYVSYFETPPDLSQLAATIGLTEAQSLTLIETLLDTVRMDKAIALPEGVQGNHEAFGRNKGNPFILRSGTAKGGMPWMGATERHKRARIVKSALKHAKQAHDFERIRIVLGEILSWLTRPDSPIFTRVGNDGYRLDLDALIFSSPAFGWNRCDKCQRLRYGEVALPCHRCDGNYQPVDIESGDHNYYRYVFRQPLYPMRVEEHTAQLSSKQGHEYQNKFKSGDINVLSCSTTFEMGIDLGDLQAVVMNNVPPEVSNYRQRAGRAGRRAGGTAFMLTWAADRSHDQTYYERPSEIIRGQVRIPSIKLDNKEIFRRHFNALLLADLLRYHKANGGGDTKTVGEMFDPQLLGGRTYDRFEAWATERNAVLVSSVVALAEMVGASVDTAQIFATFRQDIRDRAEDYNTARQLYTDNIQKSKQAYNEASGKESDAYDDERKDNEKLLNRLNEERLIDWLSNQGMLPSYAFPLYVVELEIPIQHEHNTQRDNLRLQRDLSRAIVEFAPGAEVVANKRLWESAGVRFKKDTPKVYQYRLCATCNHINAAENPGENITAEVCPICQTRYTSKTQRYLVPDGFFVDKDSGKLAGQYVRQDPVKRHYAISIPQKADQISNSSEVVVLSRQPDAKLYFINGGVWDKHGASVGYRLCAKCGFYIDKPTIKKCPRCSSPQSHMEVDLGHHVLTNTLVVRFTSDPQRQIPPKTNLDFWHTLLQALLLGASRTLQIERRDLGGVLFPMRGADNDWDRSLVLFDNVPGGAGYVEDIENHFSDVVETALELVRCAYCSEETSCTRCLRDYGNQLVHPHLKRGEVIQFLEQLDIHYKSRSRTDGIHPLLAMNPMQVLWDDTRRAKHRVLMAAQSLSDIAPIGKTQSWLDLLDDRLRAGVKVRLLLQTLPNLADADKENVVAADKLRWMLEKHPQFNVRKSNQLPMWHTLIDGKRVTRFDDTTQRVTYDFRLVNLEEAVTDDKRAEAEHLFDAAFERAQPVTPKQFQHSSTQVYRVKPMGRKVSEEDIEGIVKFFERPVVSMAVNDPYLLDYERLHNRLGNYIELASRHQRLARVDVYTRDAQLEKLSKDDQNHAIQALEKRFNEVAIKVERRTNRQAHDRWIEILREDNSRARLYIGRGLDFIRADGTVQETYLVLEEIEAK